MPSIVGPGQAERVAKVVKRTWCSPQSFKVNVQWTRVVQVANIKLNKAAFGKKVDMGWRLEGRREGVWEEGLKAEEQQDGEGDLEEEQQDGDGEEDVEEEQHREQQDGEGEDLEEQQHGEWEEDLEEEQQDGEEDREAGRGAKRLVWFDDAETRKKRQMIEQREDETRGCWQPRER